MYARIYIRMKKHTPSPVGYNRDIDMLVLKVEPLWCLSEFATLLNALPIATACITIEADQDCMWVYEP